MLRTLRCLHEPHLVCMPFVSSITKIACRTIFPFGTPQISKWQLASIHYTCGVFILRWNCQAQSSPQLTSDPPIMPDSIYATYENRYKHSTPAEALFFHSEKVKGLRVLLPDKGIEFTDDSYIGTGVFWLTCENLTAHCSCGIQILSRSRWYFLLRRYWQGSDCK